MNTVDETVAVPATEPTLLVSAQVAAELCGRSVRTWRSWDAAGRVPRPVRFGRSTLWRIDELREWIAAGCPHRDEWEESAEGRGIALSSSQTRGNS